MARTLPDWNAVTDPYERMTALVRSFPHLDRMDAEPWDATRFIESAKREGMTSSSFQAFLFVMNVWNDGYMYKVKGKSVRFNCGYALRIWDDSARAAFLNWARWPWAV